MSKGIQVLLYILVVIPLMLYITKKIDKEEKTTKSIKKFNVCISNTYMMIFIYVGWIFILLFLFVYIYNGIKFHDFDISWFYAGAVVVSIVTILCLILYLWRLNVDNDVITYRTFWGYKKTIKFSSINRVLKTDHHSLIIYANEKRFGTINSDYDGINNFIERCELEHIKIEPKSQGTLTKPRLYVKVMKPIFWLSGFVDLAVLLAYIFFPRERYTVLEICILMLFGFSLIIIPASIMPIKDLLRIYIQERALGFSFTEEMKLYNVKGVKFKNKQWFIKIHKTHIVAFRRDYIKSIGKIKKCSVESDYNGKVKIVTVKDKIRKVNSTYDILTRLAAWCK